MKAGADLKNEELQNSKGLDSGFIRLPFEQLTTIFRNSQKMVEKEISVLSTVVSEVQKKAKAQKSSQKQGTADIKKLAGKFEAKLSSSSGIKRKFEEYNLEQERFFNIFKKRIQIISNPEQENQKPQNQDSKMDLEQENAPKNEEKYDDVFSIADLEKIQEVEKDEEQAKTLQFDEEKEKIEKERQKLEDRLIIEAKKKKQQQELEDWCSFTTKRLIVDFLLKKNCFDSAKKISETAKIEVFIFYFLFFNFF